MQVGAYDPRDELLTPVWGQLAEAGLPVVVHCGSGPAPGRFTGPGPFGEVLARHPRLTAIIAHLGAPEYGEFLDLADRYPGIHLDTTMAFTDFFSAGLGRSRRGCCPGWPTSVTGSCWAATSPTSRYTYLHQLRGAGRARPGRGPGCAPSATTTPPACSACRHCPLTRGRSMTRGPR